MNGIFSIVSDRNNSIFRLRQAARPWDQDSKTSTLADKLEKGAQSFSLDEKFVRGAEAAKAALEESRRIANPKAAAEDRMAQVEKRLKEIRQEARFAAASGDREKLASLAREAALLARQAGRAAKEYASGISAAAEMGVGGDASRSGGGSTLTISSESIQTTTTTLQVRQVEVSFTLTISADGAAQAASAPAESPEAAVPSVESPAPVDTGTAGAVAASTAAQAATADDNGQNRPGGDDPADDGPARHKTSHDAAGLPVADGVQAAADVSAADAGTSSPVTAPTDAAPSADAGSSTDASPADAAPATDATADTAGSGGLPEQVRDGLAASGQPIGGFSGPAGRNLLNAMLNDNELKASRYKEADAFGRRVETALGEIKSVISEAKAANQNERNSRVQAARRKMLDDLDKNIGEAREAVNDLRGAAFGSATALSPAALLASAFTDAGTGTADTAAVSAVAPAAVDVGTVASAPSVNITA